MSSCQTPRLALWLLPLGWAGCVTTTNFQSPDQRLTDLSAYTLPAWEMRTGLGLVGTTIDTVGASIPFEVGFPGGVQLGTNVAHDIGAVPNLKLKWNALDVPYFGLGLQAGVMWSNPSLMYYLPPDIQDDYGDVDVILIPAKLSASFPILSWFDVHFDIGYQHSEIVGGVETEVDGGGSLAYREVFLEPRVGFYPWGKCALVLGAYVPVWAKANVSLSGETEIEPGVYAGATARGFQKVDVRGLYTLYLQAEMRWSATHFRVGVVQFVRFADKRFDYPLPTLDLYWRF